jgi:beta-1,4-N-acetylglucosaminyltransferase
MINVFITVGTTPFDELITHCDRTIDTSLFQCVAQVSEFSSCNVKNIVSFPFVRNINQYCQNADIIISHAGAGSVYNVLEMKKKAIFVPNNKLKDGHQEDICQFIIKHDYAEVYRLGSVTNSINELLLKVYSKTYNMYSNPKTFQLVKCIYSDLKSL